MLATEKKGEACNFLTNIKSNHARSQEYKE